MTRKEKIRYILYRFWIRKERIPLFMLGFSLAAISASLSMMWWHYLDMTEVKPKIKIDAKQQKQETFKNIKDVDYMVPLKKSSTFYKIEEYFKPE